MKKIPDRELQMSFARSSGPGGQNVNKLNTKAILKWSIQKSAVFSPSQKGILQEKLSSKINKKGELTLSSDQYRNRERNIGACKEKLERWISKALTPKKKRVPTKATKTSKMKRKLSKQKHGQKKQLRRKVEY